MRPTTPADGFARARSGATRQRQSRHNLRGGRDAQAGLYRAPRAILHTPFALSGIMCPRMGVTVRDAVIALLREQKMTTIFGNPGSTELPLFKNFPDDFRYVLGLQESVVVGMADGFAQATGNAAVVNLHSAAGVGHAMGNIFTAYRNRTPLVITAGQQARSILPYE